MKYGTLPVVSRVGGLVDTVRGYTGDNSDTATGFFISQLNEQGIFETVANALQVYTRKGVWQRLAKNAMRQDLSWERSAQAYLDLYSKTIS